MLLPLQGEGITLGIIPQGDALGYVQILPFQGAIGVKKLYVFASLR